MRELHRGPAGHFVLPQLPVGQALRLRAARGTLAPAFSHSLTRSSLLCVNCILFCGAAQMPGRPPYYTAPRRFCKGAGASVSPAHARMLWVSRQATGSRSSASVRMELISIAPLPARSVNSGVPPSRA